MTANEVTVFTVTRERFGSRSCEPAPTRPVRSILPSYAYENAHRAAPLVGLPAPDAARNTGFLRNSER